MLLILSILRANAGSIPFFEKKIKKWIVLASFSPVGQAFI